MRTGIDSLPEEIFDIIFDFLIACRQHPFASSSAPCLNWHTPPKIADVTSARLVNRRFCASLTPILFDHVSFRGHHRRSSLILLAHQSKLSRLVRTLRLDISPHDLGHDWINEVHRYPPRERPLAYFDDLKSFLTPLLNRFQDVRTVHLTTTYTGLDLAGISRADLLFLCFATLCQIVRDAGLQALECVQLGVPYEGGYAGFFEDLGHRKQLEGLSENVRTASVKLSDWQDNFTIMHLI
ncbi:MAG: hypothetical protein M1831_001149 [Alyxoria varia]|nr:MAG: hypothetical protein M1831_001149 [Alyxoria varia]